jgi:NADPH2:quinone reductase
VRALIIEEPKGPDAVRVEDVPEPAPGAKAHTGEDGVVIDVRAAAVSFPDVLQSRGLYQLKPDPPFTPGAEVAGLVRSAPAGSGFAAGDRVAALTVLGGLAEVAVAPVHLTFALPDELDFAEGAALVMNYHTVYFALKLRGRLQPGERVLVHGAAGGIGTAALQVATGLEASTVAVVSSDAKEALARACGAGDVVRSDGPWRDQVRALGGVDVVLDPVGGDRFVDSLRALREDGRLLVVGFTAGTIPEVRVNRLLLNNVSVVGAGWGAYALSKPQLNREIGAALDAMIRAGVVRPPVGARFALEQAADAMRTIEERRALGKVVVEL